MVWLSMERLAWGAGLKNIEPECLPAGRQINKSTNQQINKSQCI